MRNMTYKEFERKTLMEAQGGTKFWQVSIFKHKISQKEAAIVPLIKNKIVDVISNYIDCFKVLLTAYCYDPQTKTKFVPTEKQIKNMSIFTTLPHCKTLDINTGAIVIVKQILKLYI